MLAVASQCVGNADEEKGLGEFSRMYKKPSYRKLLVKSGKGSKDGYFSLNSLINNIYIHENISNI